MTSLVTKIYNNDSTLVVNESPTAVDDSTATQFDTAVTFSLTDNDLDSDGTIDANTVDLDPVTAGQQTSLAVVGEGEFIADNLGNVTFTPETGFTGDSIINYTVSDNAGDISNSANILVTVAVDTSGRDTLEGTELADTLTGGDSNDTLFGSLGADSLDGGEGTDRALYNASESGVNINLSDGTATGGDAEGDILTSIENLDGSRFDDTLTGDDNSNAIYAGSGADSIAGDVGDDYLSGQNGNDVISGGMAEDRLAGGGSDDTLAGDRGHDILSGGAGADSLTGTNADAVGFEEIDRLMGGAGADMFALGNDLTAFYNDGDLTSQGMGDYALIEDFDATEDTVELFGGMSYYLEASPIGIPEGMAIYLDDDGTVGMSDTDEMIGLIKDSTMAAGTIDETTPGFMMVAQNPGSEI